MRLIAGAFAGLLLSACGGQSGKASEDLTAFDVEEPSAGAAAGARQSGQPAPIKVSLPQIAYKYGYTFRLPADAIGRAQAAHVALCDRLGPARCQILKLERTGGEGEVAQASLQLRVASVLARPFGDRLQAAVAGENGRSVAATIEAEDVSKQIVDTEARLAQRTLLLGRLTEILRTRNGKVAELVEAERSLAAAQEEIDQARAWLVELRGRVAMSFIGIRYESVAATPAAESSGVGDAVSRSWAFFRAGVGELVALLIYILPWAALVGGVWLAWRAVRARLPRRPLGEE